MGKITKVFVTHMHGEFHDHFCPLACQCAHCELLVYVILTACVVHLSADHTMGLITLLRNVLGIPKPAPAPSPSSLHPPANASPHPPTSSRVHRTPRIEIYGPAGLRAFVRTVFALTHTRCDEHYAVHELLFPGEAASAAAACEVASSAAAHANEDSVHANANGEVLHTNEKDGALHANEEAGRDIAADADGFWRDILGSEQRMTSGGRVTVDAGPIVHRGMYMCSAARALCSLPYTSHTRRQIRASASSSANTNTPLPPPRTTCRARSSSWATRPTRPRSSRSYAP